MNFVHNVLDHCLSKWHALYRFVVRSTQSWVTTICNEMYNRKYIYIYPAESVLVLLSMIGKISRIREIPVTLVLSVWKNHCRIICYYTTNVVNDYACMSWVCSFLKHCQEYKPCPAVNVLWNLWHSGCLQPIAKLVKGQRPHKEFQAPNSEIFHLTRIFMSW